MTPPPGTAPPSDEDKNIAPIAIETEMRRSYLDYAMSVIVARALPDLRDGMKPVQRRILYAMHESGYLWNRPWRKSARIVGEVMGKYHPHGDKSIYDALTRMTQDFALRSPLVNGQGNFGSVDGDPPAAMRYTEARLGRVCEYLLEDIDRDTVDYLANYDSSEHEPSVLPAAFPNLLINGAGGIAVGMATNIPPHNPGEVLDACLALIRNPEMEDGEISDYIKGPDFPTGGVILGESGIRAAHSTGRGQIVMRAKYKMEEGAGGRQRIIVYELPYQVNKAAMIEKIADLVRQRRIENISALRDESDRDGIRVVIEMRRDAQEDIVLNQLWKHTALQSTFGANMVALSGGRPQILNLREMLDGFLLFREEVVTRRTRFELAKAQSRVHILCGLSIAVANIDEIVALIRGAADAAAAREALMERDWPAGDIRPILELAADPRWRVSEDDTYRLSPEQARAILDLRLHRLTALGREEIDKEMQELKVKIEEFYSILQDRTKLLAVIEGELEKMKDFFKTPRRTEIGAAPLDMEDEDFIQEEDMVVTVSHTGYIKRVPLAAYRSQKRGGKGRAAVNLRDEDFAETLFTATTHTPVLFFSSHGKVWLQKIWRLPEGKPQTRGRAMANLLSLSEGERITQVMPLTGAPESWEDMHMMFATKRGTVRRNRVADFSHINRAGKIAMKLAEGDAIAGVDFCTEKEQDVVLTTRKGRCIRFPVGDVRLFSGRNSVGVRGISLAKGDEVISMSIITHAKADVAEREAYIRQASADRRGEETEAAKISPERYEELHESEQHILTISENGYGKRTSSYDYRITRRGGKGIQAMVLSERNGKIAASFPVGQHDQIMLITQAGQAIRCPVNDIRIAARVTQGVKVFNAADKVVSVARIEEEPSQDETEE